MREPFELLRLLSLIFSHWATDLPQIRLLKKTVVPMSIIPS